MYLCCTFGRVLYFKSSDRYDSKVFLKDISVGSEVECMRDLYRDCEETESSTSVGGERNVLQTIKEEKCTVDLSDDRGTRKQRRKRSTPKRCPARYDPNFRGVRFCLQTYMDGDDSHLLISAQFSNVKAGFGGMYRKRRNSGSASSPNYWTGSDEENIPQFVKETYFTVKTCASCRTRRTPLWRDAEDGTPLCNACGIRFKKYRVRCGRCWHIPKKEVKTFPNCPSCGSSLRMSVPRRNW